VTHLINLPNLLCAIRFAGSFVLVALAWFSKSNAVIALVVVLAASDWADGKLAILLDQQTRFGALFDTAADMAFYAALVISALILRHDVIILEASWIVSAVASYLLPVSACLIRFRRFPSFHTRMAKLSWLIVLLTALLVFGFATGWPIKIVSVLVIATNLEILAIIFVLRDWKTDVPSIRAAVLEQN